MDSHLQSVNINDKVDFFDKSEKNIDETKNKDKYQLEKSTYLVKQIVETYQNKDDSSLSNETSIVPLNSIKPKNNLNQNEEEEEEENANELCIPYHDDQNHEIVQKQDAEKYIHEDKNNEKEQSQEIESSKQNENDDDEDRHHDNDDENNHNDNDDDNHNDDDDEEEEKPKNYFVEISKVVLCTACHKAIDEKDVIYHSECPYHEACVKCMKCNKTCELHQDYFFAISIMMNIKYLKSYLKRI